MEFRTPFKDPRKRRGVAVALLSAFLSLAADASVSSTPFPPPHPKVGAEFAVAASALPVTTGFDRLIEDASRLHGVRRDLIRAIIQTESEFDPRAVSSRGACGLMQLMPGTVRRFGVVDCFDGRENILAGTRFLKVLLTRYEGSVAISIAAYHAGEGAVARHRGIPPYRQTRAYVRRVQALLIGVEEGRTGRPFVTS